MEEIYTSLKKSSLFILATPVYTDTMSAQSKIVIDRCICCMEPFFTTDYEGRMRHTLSWKLSTNGQIEEELQIKIKNEFSQIVKKIEMISRSKIEKQKNNTEVLSYE